MKTPVNLDTRYLDAALDDHVLTVRIDRVAKRNSMTQDMYRGLKKAAILADENPQIDALLITGTDDVFCVGGDMSGEMEHRDAILREPDQTDHHPFRHFERCRKPIICRVNGLCHAGGVNLVLFADITIAAKSAKFCAPEIMRGIPDPHMSARLPLFIGMAAAKYFIFTGAALTADQAAAQGLIAKAVPDDDLDGEILWVLDQVRASGPRARAMMKDDINGRLPPHDVSLIQRSMLGPEMTEGMTAFLEKRPARWPRE